MCARVCVSRSFLRLLMPVQGRVLHVRGSAAPSPMEIMKEGLKVPLRWQPATGSVPCGHPLPHEEPGLASL